MIRLDEFAGRIDSAHGQQPVTYAEARVLKALLSKAGTDVSRSELHYALYCTKLTAAESNVAEVLISRLRKKLALLGHPNTIRTVRGIGYRFVGEVQHAQAA